MAVEFTPVANDEQLEELARMADEIWHEYWPAIIGDAQTDYMVATFQSLDAIKDGIAQHGYRYWFICDADEANPASETLRERLGIVGYTGGYPEADAGRFFISKIYLFAEARGRGYCSKTIAFYDGLCREEGLRSMYLTVNKHNELGIRAYRAKGFETIESVETDIGNGFIMDDFVMERAVCP